MYALSRRTDNDEDDRPRAPNRQSTAGNNVSAGLRTNERNEVPTTASFAQHHDDDDQKAKWQAARPRVSGRVATATTAADAKRSSQGNNYQMEGSKELEDYYEEDVKSGNLKGAACEVGAIPVPGSSPRRDTRSSMMSTSRTYQDSFLNSSPPEAGEGAPRTQGEAIVARCVSEDEADIEAQVQMRMNAEAKDIADRVHEHLMANAAVAQVQPSVQDTSSLTTQDQDEHMEQQRKRKRLFIIAAVVLALVVAAIGAGVAVSNKNSSPPPPAEKCTFCYDGTTPPNLETNEVLDQTCAEFRQEQIQLDSTDTKCALGQAMAVNFCECVILPPRPKNPTCRLCENGALPTGTGCYDMETLIQHLSVSPVYDCDTLRDAAYASGCSCTADDGTISAFRTLFEPISGEALDDENSPQFRALHWIANEDPADMSVGAVTDRVLVNRYVASVLYYAFGGESWLEQYNFLSQRDICSWKQSDFDGLEHGIVCNSEGNVETLRLPANKLFGSIPQEIGYLSGLTAIEMAVNTISGSLPSSLSNLSRLQTLDFTENQLTGVLPEFLFTYLHLEKIALDDNHFSGAINSLLGTSPQLVYFWLANNTLTGTLPPGIFQSSTLGSVDLHGNQLAGTIPDFSSSSALWWLRLSDNNIFGPLPRTIENSKLSDLYLYNTSMTGTLPTELGSLSDLEFFYINDNALSGPLPTELGTLTSLKEILLRDNRFTSTMPTELGNCRSLVRLDVDNNLLTGTLGSVINSLPQSIESFDFAANLLEGPIPASIGNLTNLDFFDARSNKLNGNIPGEFGKLSKLEILDLASNMLTGTVPTSIASLPVLVSFRIYDNDLTGSLDAFCTSQYAIFAANVCGEEEIECACCNHCCRPASFECQRLS